MSFAFADNFAFSGTGTLTLPTSAGEKSISFCRRTTATCSPAAESCGAIRLCSSARLGSQRADLYVAAGTYFSIGLEPAGPHAAIEIVGHDLGDAWGFEGIRRRYRRARKQLRETAPSTGTRHRHVARS